MQGQLGVCEEFRLGKSVVKLGRRYTYERNVSAGEFCGQLILRLTRLCVSNEGGKKIDNQQARTKHNKNDKRETSRHLYFVNERVGRF